jgi:hypothetical protein
MALNFLRAYMHYTTGFIAQVVALALACHAMRTEQKLARTAVVAGFAAGFAAWSHPVFGTVAMLALIAPTLYRRRELFRWWLPLAAGGVLGASPWLFFMVQNGWPESSEPTVLATYSERLTNFVTELLPRAFGLRTPGGDWVGPDPLAVGVAALLITSSIVGMLVLVVLKGAQTLPILVAGVLAFPVLALFTPLGYVADGRYAMPFLPQLLMGFGAWLLLIPERIRNSPWAGGHGADGVGAVAVRASRAAAGRLGVARSRRGCQAGGPRTGEPKDPLCRRRLLVLLPDRLPRRRAAPGGG